MKKAVDTALTFLVSSELVTELGEHLCASEFGSLVSRLYIDPRSAAFIVSGLRKNNSYTDLGVLQTICSTPDMPKLYAKNTDLPALDRMVEAHPASSGLKPPLDEDEVEPYTGRSRQLCSFQTGPMNLPMQKSASDMQLAPATSMEWWRV